MVCTGDSSSASEPAMSSPSCVTPNLGTPNGAEGGEATSMSSDVIVNVGGRGQTHRQNARFLVRPITSCLETPIRVKFVATI